uniref:Uncharacterized protein n=1 Tax=Cannabis sativa TaxID=3483 RepID=A0A803NFE3_CANSA
MDHRSSSVGEIPPYSPVPPPGPSSGGRALASLWPRRSWRRVWSLHQELGKAKLILSINPNSGDSNLSRVIVPALEALIMEKTLGMRSLPWPREKYPVISPRRPEEKASLKAGLTSGRT